ncbi:MAG: zf-HC2 domain-containing protein [Acidimicrobiales bacterium]|nr:zf-HC2 domain-containing protein [Actinomycetota bacterium]
MTCDPWLELISAATDGELDDAEQDALDAHLARCASCRELAARFGALRRRTLVGVADAVPDLAPLVVARHEARRDVGATLARRGGVAAVAVAAVVALVVGVLGSSRPFDPTGRGPEVADAGTPRVVTAADRAFSAPDLSVHAGDSVEWLNGSDTEHRLVRRIGGTTLASDLDPGQAEVVTFDEPGVYPYYCSIHRGMTGRVVVTS